MDHAQLVALRQFAAALPSETSMSVEAGDLCSITAELLATRELLARLGADLKTVFMIRPAPSQAPRPDVEYAQHPSILEVASAGSPNFLIENLRRERHRYELLLLLNLLLGGHISGESTRGRHHWVLTPNSDVAPGMWGTAWR